MFYPEEKAFEHIVEEVLETAWCKLHCIPICWCHTASYVSIIPVCPNDLIKEGEECHQKFIEKI